MHILISYHSIIHNHIAGSAFQCDINTDRIEIAVSFDCDDVITEKRGEISLRQLNIFDIECNMDGVYLYLEEGVLPTVMVVRNAEVKGVVNKTLLI